MAILDNRYSYVIVAVLLVLGMCKYVITYVHRRKYKLPPGPKGLPLLGYIGDLSFKSLWDHKDRYGDISYIKVLGTDIVILNSSEAMRDAFLTVGSQFDDRPNSFIMKFLALDDISFNSPTLPYWKKLRQMMHTSLKAYGRGIDTIEEVVKEELSHLESVLLKADSSVDLHNVLEPSIVNIMYIIVSNIRFPYDHPMIRMPLLYLENFNYLSSLMIDRVLTLFPFLLYIPMGIGKLYKQTVAYRETLINFMLERNDSLLNDKKSMLFQLLEEQKRFQNTISIDNIKGLVDDIFGAGINTTASSLYHFFLIMLHYPEIQCRIQREIDDVICGNRRPCVADKVNMPYTQAAILELMRYGSLVPLSLQHMCIKDTKLRNFILPKRTIIIPNQFRVNHDPDVWKNPWTFEPSRFLDDEGSLLPASDPICKNAVAFGLGVRACPGEVFAKTRMFLFITHLLKTFHFKPAGAFPSCNPCDFQDAFIIRPSQYRVRLERRNLQ